MPTETRFDVGFVAEAALREKQIQQNYRPVVAVHKWFARRPGSLFRGLVLSEFGDGPLSDAFFRPHDFPGRAVADPFMGGGTPLLEANRVGCDVLGFDVNPMAAWVTREEIEHIDLASYRAAADRLLAELDATVGPCHLTNCPIHGDEGVPVKYFLWVKQIDCDGCAGPIDLFPGHLLADDSRHPKNVLVCWSCGGLNEVESIKSPGTCRDCSEALRVEGPARRGRCACPRCGAENAYPRPEAGPPRHRMFAIEYYNPSRRERRKGRFFKKPDAADLARYREAEDRWRATAPRFVPTQAIPRGDETDRLHRWGYDEYRELFNPRQLLGLELSARFIAGVKDDRIRRALATNLSDLLRYQNMLCRYDTTALKSLDVFSVHGFPVGLVACESNLLGIAGATGASVGSGGWTNVVAKYARAKRYCDAPFETSFAGARKVQVPIVGEWIGERREGSRPRKVSIRCASSTDVELPPNSLDAVFTDPPYFGNVQYGELMDFCYVWLRRLVGDGPEGFRRESCRRAEELTGNQTQGRDLAHFAEGLAAVYANMARALKPGAPLAFTFHHNKLDAYKAVAAAILDSGLTCSASIPCPAEMAGSIHIHGTGSSIVDTVFVCRDHGETLKRWLFTTPAELARVVADDLETLRAAGLKGTRGDTRCMLFGHLTRMVVWNLRAKWDRSQPTRDKLDLIGRAMARFGDLAPIIDEVSREPGDVETPGVSNR